MQEIVNIVQKPKIEPEAFVVSEWKNVKWALLWDPIVFEVLYFPAIRR